MSIELESSDLSQRQLIGSADVALYCQPISHEKRLEIMSEDEWEDVTLEYADALNSNSKYIKIFKLAGAGDKGRDIAALYSEPLERGKWDCYQCKHYGSPLSLSQILLEFGKLCFYTFINEWPLPQKYFFVSPKGLGPELTDILTKPEHDKIRDRLISKWDTDCKSLCKLTSELKDYINSFDFSIVSFIPQQDIIKTLHNSRWGTIRFGGGLPIRPQNPPLPALSVEQEQKLLYIQALIDAYNDHLKRNDITLDNLNTESSKSFEHLLRSRKAFHSAEALKRFSREFTPPETFDALLKEIETGIIDIVDWPQYTGYERVLKVVAQAKNLPLTVSLLDSRISSLDREGMCHHLANEKNRVKWVKK